MPISSTPTAPYMSRLTYRGAFGGHHIDFFHDTLVPTATGDPSGFDYGYGPSAGEGFYAGMTACIDDIRTMFHSTTTLEQFTLYFKNPSPPPTYLPQWSIAVGVAGTATASDVESSQATIVLAEAFNHKARLTLLDVAFVPPSRIAINVAGTNPWDALAGRGVVQGRYVTRFQEPLTRALFWTVRYNKAFIRKRGQ